MVKIEQLSWAVWFIYLIVWHKSISEHLQMLKRVYIIKFIVKKRTFILHMNDPAYPSTQTPIRPHLTYTDYNYTILLLLDKGRILVDSTSLTYILLNIAMVSIYFFVGDVNIDSKILIRKNLIHNLKLLPSNRLQKSCTTSPHQF